MGKWRNFYKGIMSKRFGEGELPKGFEITYLLKECDVETPDGEIYMHRTDAGDFAKGRSMNDLLRSDKGLTLYQLQGIRDYGAVLCQNVSRMEIQTYGKIIYLLACANALVRHGDPLTDRTRGKQIEDIGNAMASNLVPEEFMSLLEEARAELEAA